MAETQLTEQEIAVLQQQRDAMAAVILVASAFRGKLGEIKEKHKDLAPDEVEVIEEIREFFRNMVQELVTTLGITKEDLKKILLQSDEVR